MKRNRAAEEEDKYEDDDSEVDYEQLDNEIVKISSALYNPKKKCRKETFDSKINNALEAVGLYRDIQSIVDEYIQPRIPNLWQLYDNESMFSWSRDELNRKLYMLSKNVEALHELNILVELGQQLVKDCILQQNWNIPLNNDVMITTIPTGASILTSLIRNLDNDIKLIYMKFGIQRYKRYRSFAFDIVKSTLFYNLTPLHEPDDIHLREIPYTSTLCYAVYIYRDANGCRRFIRFD